MTDRVSTRHAEVLARVLETERAHLHTALPGTVRSYDPDTQTADVEIGVRRVLQASDDDDPDVAEDLPILPSVPVLWPSSTADGGGYLHMPLAAGSGVWVVFAEADITQWRATGEVSDPAEPTRHGLSGAYAIPGAHWRGNPNPDASPDGPESPAGVRLGYRGGPRLEIVTGQIRAGGTGRLVEHDGMSTILTAIFADLTTLRASVIANGGTVPPLTAETLEAATEYATSTLRGT